MTEELMELLNSLKQVYKISQDDFDVLTEAIETTIMEATGAVEDEANAVGEEMARQYAEGYPEEGYEG